MQKPERKRVLLIMEFEKAPGKRNRDIKELEVYLPDGRGAETNLAALCQEGQEPAQKGQRSGAVHCEVDS